MVSRHFLNVNWFYFNSLSLSLLGVLLTFSQFASVTIWHLPHFLTFPYKRSRSLKCLIPKFKPRQVPLYDWAFIVSGFITVNLLNNFAFKYVSFYLFLKYRFIYCYFTFILDLKYL